MKKEQEEGKFTEKVVLKNKEPNTNDTIAKTNTSSTNINPPITTHNGITMSEDKTIYINPDVQEFSVLTKIIQIWYYRAK